MPPSSGLPELENTAISGRSIEPAPRPTLSARNPYTDDKVLVHIPEAMQVSRAVMKLVARGRPAPNFSGGPCSVRSLKAAGDGKDDSAILPFHAPDVRSSRPRRARQGRHRRDR